MDKLKLPQVTLVAMTGKDVPAHRKALKESSRGIKWGKVLLLSPENDSVTWGNRTDETGFEDFSLHNKRIDPITSIDNWNYKIIYELPKYIETSHAMLIHADGYVINPHLWKDEWLELDFIGSPFPLPTDDYSYRDEEGEIQRVGNSVSLRSKKLMERVSQFEWKSYHGNTNEDGFISVHHRKQLEKEGFKFGTFEQSLDFGREHDLPEHKGRETFAFHQVD